MTLLGVGGAVDRMAFAEHLKISLHHCVNNISLHYTKKSRHKGDTQSHRVNNTEKFIGGDQHG